MICWPGLKPSARFHSRGSIGTPALLRRHRRCGRAPAGARSASRVALREEVVRERQQARPAPDRVAARGLRGRRGDGDDRGASQHRGDELPCHLLPLLLGSARHASGRSTIRPMAVDTSRVAQLDVEPGELPATMAAWVIREERLGEPLDAFQLEEMAVPEPGAFEVVVRVMAAGVNFNNVWAALGKPVSVFRYHAEDHHIGGSDASGHRLEGRRGRHALEARRRGRPPLQPGLLRGRRGPRARPARGAVPADLGLRDHLGLVRAVLQGPGPAVPAQAHAPDVGGGGHLRPDLLHGLPDADRPGASSSPATAC